MRRILPLLPLLLLAVALGIRMALGGYLHGDDAYIHTAWAQQFLSGLDAGALYPRWVAATNAGCGSPSFVFYPPLVFYSYAPWDLFTDDVGAMMLLSGTLAVLLSGAAMYGLARSVAGPWIACGAACLYMALPYHLLDLCYRAAMAELWAFAWAPLAFWGAQMVATRRPSGLPVLALAVGGLLLTHLPSALLMGASLVPFLIHAGVRTRGASEPLRQLLGMAAGVALAAVFLVPLLAEWDQVSLGAMSRYAPGENFLFMPDAWDPELNRRVSAAGLATLALCIVAIADGLLPGRSTTPGHLPGPLFSGLCGVACFLLMLRPSQAIWDHVPLLGRVGFPWRMLVPMSLFAALGVAHGLRGIVDAGAGWRRWTIGVPLGLALLVSGGLGVAAAVAYRGFEESRRLDFAPTMPFHELEENLNLLNPRALSLRDMGEYRPRWSVLHDPDDPLGIVMPSAFHRSEWAIFTGGGGAKTTVWEPERRKIDLGSSRGGQLLLRLFYYPAWRATADGREAATSPHPDSGLMVVEVPAGARTVELSYRRSSAHLAGAALSVASLTGLVALAVIAGRRREGHDTPREARRPPSGG